MAVVVSVVGGSRKFSHRMVKSQKPPLLVPLYNNGYYCIEGDGTRGEDGELVVSMQSSSYNDTKLRDAVIKSAALTAQTVTRRNMFYAKKVNAQRRR